MWEKTALLENVTVVMFKPKYPENVGSVARACANMGCKDIILVAPPNFSVEKALPLATASGKTILESVAIKENLVDALSGFSQVWGTTARTGGWRKGISTPATAAKEIIENIRQDGKTAILFGPEDRGLTNEETRVCNGLMTIPTSSDSTSLNVSQAVLVVLYECFKAALDRPFSPAGPPEERPAMFEEKETLFEAIKQALVDISFLKEDNPDYWMMPVRRFVNRISLKRNEFNLLMGICRQIKWIAGRAKEADKK